jgi:hypothetical protein
MKHQDVSLGGASARLIPDSGMGSRFVERILMVIFTLQQGGRELDDPGFDNSVLFEFRALRLKDGAERIIGVGSTKVRPWIPTFYFNQRSNQSSVAARICGV